jgi:1,4-dihydroxy-6-naphthoate synthase
LTLGFSPCPNDTYVFCAWVHGLVAGAPAVRVELADIETLNHRALAGDLAVAKVSFHALGHLLPHYSLLRAGGALGRGCGPLVVARGHLEREALASARVAIPGALTTAALLLRLYLGIGARPPVVMPFRDIMPAVARGEVDAGVIIHESRFTFPRHGLVQVLDLGAWWEATSGHPIPLGGIVARRDLGCQVLAGLDDGLRRSVEYANAAPDQVRGFVRLHAAELDEAVINGHIALYVNDFTLDYGAAGVAAITDLLARAAALGLVPAPTVPLFAHQA